MKKNLILIFNISIFLLLGFISSFGSSNLANAANMISFDGNTSKITIPIWVATGDFTITLSDVIFGERGSTNRQLGTLFGNGTYSQYMGLSNGGVLIGPRNKTSLETFPFGHRSSIIIKREGDVVSVEIVGGTGAVSLIDDSDYVIDRIGDLNDKSIFAFDGSIAGTITMLDHAGGDNRTYDFNQPVGSSTLIDTQSGQNGTLENFSNGFGFVVDVGNEIISSNMVSFSRLQGKITIPTWTAVGDFTITLSDVIYGEHGALEGHFAALLSNGSTQYSGLSNGGVLIGSPNQETSEGFVLGDRATLIIKREGASVSMSVEGSSELVSFTDSSPYVVDRIGDLNGNPLFAFDGAIAGTITMVDNAGGDNRTYDFNQPLDSTVLVDTQSQQHGVLENFPAGFGFVADKGQAHYVLFKKSDNNRVAIPAWTANGDFSMVFSDVIVGYEGANRSEVLASSKALAEQGVHEFIAFQHGKLFLYFQGSYAISSNSFVLNEGDRVEVVINRTGTTVTASVTGIPEVLTLESSTPFIIDSFGTNGDISLSMDGAIAGTVTLIDHEGSDNRTYDFNQPAGSAVLVDVQSGNHGTLQSFDEGFGFVEDPEANGVTNLGSGADVWILAGQSQMEGANNIVEGINDVYDGLESFYQYGYTKRIKVATNPLEHSALAAGVRRFGPWREFALEIINNGIVNGRPQLLVPVATSGSGFPSWSPGGVNYNRMVDRVNLAMATNSGNVLRGILWAQGESNIQDSTATHQSNLQNMHNNMLNDINGMTTSTAFVSLLLHPDEVIVDSVAQDVIDINAAITNFSSALENSATIDTADLILNADNIHFDSDSIREIGRRYAEKFYQLLNN